MRRALALLVAAVLCLSLAPPAGGVPDARLTVDDVAVSPDRPTTGEPVTVTGTVSLSAGSNSAVELDGIALRNAEGDVLARAENPGSLSPGDSATVDLVATFRDPGVRALTLVAEGTDADGERVTVERPVTVVVEESPPGIELEAALVEGVASPVTVELSNPGVDPVRNVEAVALVGEGVDDRAVTPVIAAGGSTTLNLSVTPSAGRETVAVRVSYTTVTGDRQRTVRNEQFAVDPLEDDVGIEVREVRPAQENADVGGIEGLVGDAAPDGGNLQEGEATGEETDRVEVAVTNFGNARAVDAVVVPTAEERLPRQFVGDLAPGETEAVTVDLSEAPPGELDVAVEYRLGGEPREATTAYDHRPETAALALTGVDVERLEDGRVRITGNAGNTGEAEVTGAVVAVRNAEWVAPAYPQRDYFVGTVAGSEFAPFELTARVDENASTVPVEVTYRVDGRTVTESAELPVDDLPPAGEEDGSNPSLAVGLGVGVAALIGAAVLVPIYRRRR